MLDLLIYFIVAALCMYPTISYAIPHNMPGCQPLHMTFPAASIGRNSPFVPITPSNTYAMTSNGLALYLLKPAGPVISRNSVNDKLGSGATFNSTFLLSHGVTSVLMTAPTLRGCGGAVLAFILMGHDTHDEIDVELLCGDPSHWQTNAYAPAQKDVAPLYSAQSSTESVPRSNNNDPPTIGQPHKYTIDWNNDRILWSIDDKPVRTLTSKTAVVDGVSRFPRHPMRMQFGIWDGSNPRGTSEWSRGPINWNKLPDRLTATVHSVTVECP